PQPPGRSAHPPQELVQPSARPLARKRESEQKEPGRGAHRSEVACRPGQGFIADGIRGMRPGKEVDALKESVAGQDQFRTPNRPNHCGIVPYPKAQSTRPAPSL